MTFKTKQFVQTALLLALCIVSQYFKNFSVYITGPIINTILIIATLAVGLYSGLIISVITPVTAFIITGSPIMAAIPAILPVIILGNVILVCSTYYFQNKHNFKYHLQAGLFVGSILKAIFMGAVIVLVLLPLLGDNIASHLPKPEVLPMVLATAKITFSVTQLITAFLGSILAYLIWMPLKKYLKAENEGK